MIKIYQRRSREVGGRRRFTQRRSVEPPPAPAFAGATRSGQQGRKKGHFPPRGKYPTRDRDDADPPFADRFSQSCRRGSGRGAGSGRVAWRQWRGQDQHIGGRSAEHTSELQSLMRISSATFCLKKNKMR